MLIFFYFFLSLQGLPFFRKLKLTRNQRLIQLIIDGDHPAFEEAYKLYFADLLRAAYRRLAHAQLAEDIVQEVFVNLWNKRQNLDVEGNLAAYLHATLRNKVLNEIRSIYIQRKFIGPMEEHMEVIDSMSSDDEIIGAETAQRIHAAINTMPPQCKKAFLFSRFKHLSYKEIADEMNISVNTVEKHIGKALQILRTQLGPKIVGLFLCLHNPMIVQTNCYIWPI